MKEILKLQSLKADDEVSLHAASTESVQCKDRSNWSWFGC